MADSSKQKRRRGFGPLVPTGDRIIAVDAGSRVVKIAEIRRRKERIELRLVDAMPVPFASSRGDVTPEQVCETLHRLLQKHGIKSGAMISILPREYVTVKRFELPSVSRDELAQMLPFEAEKHVPFALDRAQLDFDFHPLGEAAQAAAHAVAEAAADGAVETPAAAALRSTVTLAAVRQAVIPKFLALLAVRGFKQHAIDVSTFALYNAFTYFAQRAPEAYGDGDALLVEIGARRTEVTLVSGVTQDLLFSRSMDFGGDMLTDAIAAQGKLSFEEAERRKCEQWQSTPLAQDAALLRAALQPLVDQLGKSVQYMHKTALTARIGAVWLSGGASMTPGVAEAVAGACGVEARTFNPLAAFDAESGGAAPVMCAQAVGAALRVARETRLTVDLLPVDIAKLQLFAVRKKRLLQLAAAAGVIAAVALSVFGVRIATSSWERTELREELDRLLPEERRVDALEREYVSLSNAVTDMERLIDTKTSWSRVFQTVSECMNSNVWVWQVNLDNRQRNNRLMLYTRAATRMDYIDFKDRLSASARFRNVTAGTVQQQNQYIEVPITCEVLPDFKYAERMDELRTLLGGARAPAPVTNAPAARRSVTNAAAGATLRAALPTNPAPTATLRVDLPTNPAPTAIRTLTNSLALPEAALTP